MTGRLLILVLSVLGLWAFARTAPAQSYIQWVATEAGVRVAVPAGLRPALGLAALPDTPLKVAGLATFTDDGERPLNIQIRAGAPHDWASLPAPDAALAAEWTRRLATDND